MPRGELISTRAAEGVERLRDLFAEFVRDGHISQREQYELRLVITTVHDDVQEVHQGMAFISRATQGHGIRGEWFGRLARAHVEDRGLVVLDDDPEPEPPATVMAKRRAA